MATITKKKPAKPKPLDTCKLTVTIRGERYTARPLTPGTSGVIRAWRLRKADGTCYTVADTLDGASCECGDFHWRHEGQDHLGCKHVRALRALGLIDQGSEDSADWPAWTDTHAYTVAH
jgi:hypothetical protein